MRPTLLTVLGVVLTAGMTQAQPVLTWTPMPRQWPIARLEAPMAYDSANQRVVVFNGYDHGYNRYNEVWEYYPAYQAWYHATPSSGAAPVPRSGSTVAYDSARGRMLLFGGLDDARGYLGDTWEWDCNVRTWTQVATGGTPGVNKPTPRQGVRMAYDAAGDRYVLFGGVDANQFYKDTWTFNPSTRTWSLLSATVSSGNGRLLRGRTFHAMSFAGGPNRLFLFGGLGFDNDFPYPGGTGAVKNFEDVWELVGTVWTDRTPSGVQAGNQGGCATASACPGRPATGRWPTTRPATGWSRRAAGSRPPSATCRPPTLSPCPATPGAWSAAPSAATSTPRSVTATTWSTPAWSRGWSCTGAT